MIKDKQKLSFETFARGTRRSSVEPLISIQKRGTLCLNAAAYKLLKGDCRELKKHPRRKNESDIFVELLYDRENKVIALKYVTPDNPNSFVVRKQPESESYLVSAKGFLKHYGIRPAKVTRYTARMFDPDVIVFSLEKP